MSDIDLRYVDLEGIRYFRGEDVAELLISVNQFKAARSIRDHLGSEEPKPDVNEWQDRGIFE